MCDPLRQGHATLVIARALLADERQCGCGVAAGQRQAFTHTLSRARWTWQSGRQSQFVQPFAHEGNQQTHSAGDTAGAALTHDAWHTRQ